MRTSTCHKCHEAIWFGETERGKVVPVNTWTSEKGKVYPIDPEADRPMLHFIKKDEDPPPEGTLLYFSHFVTCRKKGRSKG